MKSVMYVAIITGLIYGLIDSAVSGSQAPAWTLFSVLLVAFLGAALRDLASFSRRYNAAKEAAEQAKKNVQAQYGGGIFNHDNKN